MRVCVVCLDAAHRASAERVFAGFAADTVEFPLYGSRLCGRRFDLLVFWGVGEALRRDGDRAWDAVVDFQTFLVPDGEVAYL